MRWAAQSCGTINSEAQMLFILLAGGLSESPLRRTLRMPLLQLPLNNACNVLDLWLQCAESMQRNVRVVVVVSTTTDAESIRHQLTQRAGRLQSMQTDVLLEPDRWRGPAGLVRDVVDRCSDGQSRDVVAVAEASCLPLAHAANALATWQRTTSGISLLGRGDQPAGMYFFSDDAVQVIPRVGYFDIKEQLLPALYARGRPVAALGLDDPVHSVRDRQSYLDAVQGASTILPARPCAARVDPTARVLGGSIIHNASVGRGALIHRSVVLDGAVIEPDAVVSQCVVGPGCRVHARQVARGEVLDAARAHRRSRMRVAWRSPTRATTGAIG